MEVFTNWKLLRSGISIAKYVFINSPCRMYGLKEVQITSTIINGYLSQNSFSIQKNGLFWSLKIFQDLVAPSDGQRCMFTTFILIRQAGILWAVHHLYHDHCNCTRYEELPIRHNNLLLPVQVNKKWFESQATSSFSMNGVKWSQQWLALDGTDAGPNEIICSPVTIYTGR